MPTPTWVKITYDKAAEISISDMQGFVRSVAYHSKAYEQRGTRIDQTSCTVIDFATHSDKRNPKNDRVIVTLGKYNQNCTEGPSYKKRRNDATKERTVTKRLCFYRIPRCDRGYEAETKKLQQQIKAVDRRLEGLMLEPDSKRGFKGELLDDRKKLVAKLAGRVAIEMHLDLKQSEGSDKGDALDDPDREAMFMVLALYAGYASRQNPSFSFRTDQTVRVTEYNKATDTCVERDQDVHLERAIALIEFERSTAAQIVKMDRYTIGVVEMASQLGRDELHTPALSVYNVTRETKKPRLQVRKAYEIIYDKRQGVNGLRPIPKSGQTKCMVQAINSDEADTGELLCVVGGQNDGDLIEVMHGFTDPLTEQKKKALMQYMNARRALMKAKLGK